MMTNEQKITEETNPNPGNPFVSVVKKIAHVLSIIIFILFAPFLASFLLFFDLNYWYTDGGVAMTGGIILAFFGLFVVKKYRNEQGWLKIFAITATALFILCILFFLLFLQEIYLFNSYIIIFAAVFFFIKFRKLFVNSVDSPVPVVKQETPIAVKIISVLAYLFAGLTLSYGLLGLFFFVTGDHIPIGNIIAMMSIPPGIFCLYIARGLWKRKNWARIIAVTALFTLLLVPLDELIIRHQNQIYNAITIMIESFLIWYLAFNKNILWEERKLLNKK